MWRGKKVLLGVTGSIAAYKTTFLTRLLIKAGADVKIVLSPSARDFVTPLTLATLSRNPVYWEYFDPEDDSGEWHNHVDMALWADLLLIAPATSNTLSKMVAGTADNLLLGIYMSAKCPVYFAPAMDLDMYRHPATQGNIQQLQSFGHSFIPAGTGALASGLEGEGRMAEPEEIMAFLEEKEKAKLPYRGKKILINAGPTQEAIDPVRYIGNHSSGKMGVALAEQAAQLGGDVTLILGPGSVKPKQPSAIKVHHIVSAREMNEVCQRYFPEVDIALLSAAIADYRPAEVAGAKLKKDGKDLVLKLVENPDVLKGLGEIKKPHQLLIGFALETDNAIAHAKAKLHKKNCDLIVLNTPSEKGSGFGYDTNEVTLIDRAGKTHTLELKSKKEIAKEILDYIRAYWPA